MAYFLLLQQDYRKGDLSLVYPTARATGLFLSTIFAVVILGEHLTMPIVIGGLAVVVGVVFLTGGFRKTAGHMKTSLAFGLGAGLLIGSYTACDAYTVSILVVPLLLLDYTSRLTRAAPYALLGAVRAAPAGGCPAAMAGAQGGRPRHRGLQPARLHPGADRVRLHPGGLCDTGTRGQRPDHCDDGFVIARRRPAAPAHGLSVPDRLGDGAVVAGVADARLTPAVRPELRRGRSRGAGSCRNRSRPCASPSGCRSPACRQADSRACRRIPA